MSMTVEADNREGELAINRMLKAKDMALALWKIRENLYGPEEDINVSRVLFRGILEDYGVNLDDLIE